MITPPEWLTEPVALKIWAEMICRLEKKGVLETTDPNILGAYCYCMERALFYSTVDPKSIDWIGARAPADKSFIEPRWVGYPHRPDENQLVYLWRRGAAYASNLLGLWPQKHISYFELGLYDNWNELNPEDHLVYKHGGEVIFRLDRAWQVGED